MQLHFWYILIHIGLGLVGYRVFLFTNTGGLYAAAAAAVVQGYAVWELSRMAKPRFAAALAGAASVKTRAQMVRDYRTRLFRVWVFRTCIYALLTLVAAMAVRGGD